MDEKTPEPFVVLPRYLAGFQCVASSCPDHCCQDFVLGVTTRTAAKIKDVADPELLRKFQEHVQAVDDEEKKKPGAKPLKLRFMERNCPFLDADGRCEIQTKLGKPRMFEICRDFPRSMIKIGACRYELGADMSCEEIARLALRRQLTSFVKYPKNRCPNQPGVYSIRGGDALPQLTTTRDLVFCILRQDAYSVEEKLILCMLFHHLQEEVKIDDGTFKKRAIEFHHDVANKPTFMRNQLSSIQRNLRLQLMFLAQLDHLLRDSKEIMPLKQSFRDAFEIREGKHSVQGLENYSRMMTNSYPAIQQYYAPILVNYWINDLFFRHFPYIGEEPWMSFQAMAVEFALLRAYLMAFLKTKKTIDDQNIIPVVSKFYRRVAVRGAFHDKVIKFLRKRVEAGDIFPSMCLVVSPS